MIRPTISVAAARLRAEPAARFLPVAIVLAHLVGMGDGSAAPGYPLAEAARAQASIIVLAPAAAAFAAWKAGRLRRAGWDRRPWRRPPWRVALAESLATTSVLLVAYVAVGATVAVASHEPVAFDPGLAAVAACVVLGFASAGFAAGWWVRTEVAIPAVLVAGYGAMVMPVGMEPLWIRHLSGVGWDCCFDDQVLDAGSVRGPIILGLALAAGCWALPMVRLRPIAALIAAVVVAAGVAVSVQQVDHLGYAPVAPRHGRVVCAGHEPRICLWPEQRDALPLVVRTSATAAGAWRADGLMVPDSFTVKGPRAPGSVDVQIPAGASEAEVISNLAYAVVPDADGPTAPSATTAEPCDHGDVTGGPDPRTVLRAYLEVRAGRPRAAVGRQYGLGRGRELDAAIHLGRSARLRWIAQVEGSTGSCRPPPGGPR